MSQPTVTVDQGKLSGKCSSDIDGGKFYSFQGIPYAKPPVGDLRFKAPEPPEPWSGIFDATQEGNPCYSKHMIFQNIIGSEDCLFINVYTRNIQGETSLLKPVMVWIHGGAFQGGSSKTDFYGPEYLMTQDVVLVTFNYRVGILGCLHLDDPELGVPGNAGMKDMVMALRWVQKNIESFCGDPNKVTVFGESAGGTSVHYLMLSPLAKGLFHAGIAQSGSALNSFSTGRKELASVIASTLELETERQVLERLRSMPIQELFELSEKVIDSPEILENSRGRLPYAPTIEKPSPEAFISEEPIKIVRSGRYNHVPIIFGYTTTEGMLIEFKIRPRKPTIPSDFEHLVPYALNVVRGSEDSKRIAGRMKEFYYGEVGSEERLENFYKIHTDNYFLRDIWFAARFHAATSRCPVYLYRMSVDTKLNIFKKIGNITAPGVCHGDDIAYLFKTKISPPLEPGGLEEVSVRRFVKYWTNFARTGDPNPLDGAPNWERVEKDKINFIDIGTEIKADVNPDHERMQFWKEIYQLNPEYLL